MPIDPIPASRPAIQTRDDRLRAAAEEMEAGFLAEMLDAAGLGKTSESFGGGAGEDQFASLLVHEQAKQIVRSGGIGLAEMIFDSLKEQQHD